MALYKSNSRVLKVVKIMSENKSDEKLIPEKIGDFQILEEIDKKTSSRVSSIKNVKVFKCTDSKNEQE